MNRVITGIYPDKNSFKVVNIFGYSSRSIPGLEIIGMGQLARGVKEKLIYLTRVNGLKMPLRRHVLCVELHQDLRDAKLRSWLELPLLLLFWSLAEIMPLDKKHRYFAAGKVGLGGEIEHLSLPVPLIDELVGKGMKYISSPEEHGLALERVLPFLGGEKRKNNACLKEGQTVTMF